jgi:hypothetical protein
LKSGNPQLIRQYNQDTIKNLIFEKGPITKTMIANLTSLSVPTVNKIVDDLGLRIGVSGCGNRRNIG